MKRFEISFEYTADYANVVHAESMEEAIYKVMKDINLSKKVIIQPHVGTLHIRETPQPAGQPGILEQ